MTETTMDRPRMISISLAVEVQKSKQVLLFKSWAEEAAYLRVCKAGEGGCHAANLMTTLSSCEYAVAAGLSENGIKVAIQSLIAGEWIEQRGQDLFVTKFERSIVCQFV